MNTIGARFKYIRDFSCYNQADFARFIDVNASLISDIERGEKEPSKKVIINLIKRYNLNSNWLLTGEGEPFLTEKKQEIPPLISELEKTMDTRIEKTTADKFENIESQLIELKKEIEKLSAKQRSDDGTELYEPEPPYCPMVKIPFVDNIAAGSPIEQNYIQGTEITIPKTLIKGNVNDYYTARIAGESMTESGIFNGDVVLIKKNEEPIHSKIQVVRYKNKSTLKRLCKNGETWELHFEDGTNRVIPVHENDYQVQGDFIAVINKFVK